MIRYLKAAVPAAALLALAACATTAEEPSASAAAAPAPAAAPNPAIAQGQGIFQARCSGCHSGAGAAPSREVLRGKGHDTIVTALTTGKMMRQGAALSDEEKNAVATFLVEGPAA